MEIIIRGEKMKITDAMKDYAEEKLSKLDKYLGNSSDVRANVIVKVRNHQNKVEITIPLKSFILRSEETQEDFYAAVDKAIDVLERQVRKNKTRLMAVRQVKKQVQDFIIDSIEYEDEDEKETNKIVKRKTIEVKPMNEEEAILQMELLGHQFYMFKDSETDKPAVVYKRNDGNYGLIETE